MAMDTPAKIAVLGAGPIGLEAALYARYLGYDVEIFDRGDVAQNVKNWGHVRLFTPFRMNSTRLGLAAIHAQDENYRPPAPDALITGNQWRDQYLLPLAQTDLLVDHLRLNVTVVSVSRQDFLKYEFVGEEQREDSPFRLLLNDSNRETESSADVVIDTTGVYGNPNWLGPGGGPAIQEQALRNLIRYDLPDVAGSDRERYANKRVLVVGAGLSAATTITSLIDISATASQTRIVWVTRDAARQDNIGPIVEMANDPLAERLRIARAANQAVSDHPMFLTHWPETNLQALQWDEGRRAFTVQFRGRHSGVGEFDEVIANVGYRPDNRLYSELQIHECYASGGPKRLARKLAESTTLDHLAPTSHGADSLVNPEPHFYILGAKSYGRNSEFLVTIGYQQIRDLFSLIGERETLDLYRG